MGMAFLPENFVKGAEFDRTVERAVNGLFSAEPFKTYRDYFDIYQIAAYSKEEGASIVKSGSESVIRDTRLTCASWRALPCKLEMVGRETAKYMIS